MKIINDCFLTMACRLLHRYYYITNLKSRYCLQQLIPLLVFFGVEGTDLKSILPPSPSPLICLSIISLKDEIFELVLFYNNFYLETIRLEILLTLQPIFLYQLQSIF